MPQGWENQKKIKEMHFRQRFKSQNLIKDNPK